MQRDDSLSEDGRRFLKNLLAAERQRLTAGNAARQDELRQSIRRRDAELRDDYGIYRQFELHLDALPFGERPANERQKAVLYAAWEDERRAELAGWQETLAALQAEPIAGPEVFDAAKERLLRLLTDAARELGLLPRQHIRENSGQAPTAETIVASEQPTAPMASAQVQSGNRGRRGSRRRWIHPSRPDNVITLNDAYQLVKDDASELAIAKISARVAAGEIQRSSSGNQIWKVKMDAVNAAGYVRLGPR